MLRMVSKFSISWVEIFLIQIQYSYNILFHFIILFYFDFQETLDSIIYCNAFRQQLEQFEAVFVRNEFHRIFSSFVSFLKGAILTLNVEREKRKEGEVVFNEKDTGSTFRNLTRIEKWQTIIVCFNDCNRCNAPNH